MPSYCHFDIFPVELLYNLFSYFSADELLLTFSQISDYVNEVLLSYSNYYIYFKSIRRSDFDRVCHHIRPNQVISLTLSDDRDTPGQSELFIFHFRIEQFIRLRSLTLIQIEVDSLRLIISSLHQLDQLRSLSINTELISDIQDQLINVNFKILSQLNRLHLEDSTMLKSINLPNLRYLKLDKISNIELKIIFQHVPQLESLDICLNVKNSYFNCKLPVNRLIRLNLKIENYYISMYEMEPFLIQLPCLKHFKLETNGLENLVDGYRWQVLANSFITFNIAVNAQYFRLGKALISFSSPFWLETKRWFVACQNYRLFSIPHFAHYHIDISQEPNIYSTAPEIFIVYDHIDKVTVKTAVINHNYSLTHIKTLELKYSIPFKTIASVIGLTQIKRLTILSLDDLLMFTPLVNVMPQLCDLTIEYSVEYDTIKKMKHHQFEQIQKLKIGVDKKYRDYIIEKLFIIFPHIQHLTYIRLIQSKNEMISFIDGFKYLSYAFFFTDSSFYKKEIEFCRNLNSISEHSQRLTKDNFTCRFYNLSNTDILFDIHWWIG